MKIGALLLTTSLAVSAEGRLNFGQFVNKMSSKSDNGAAAEPAADQAERELAHDNSNTYTPKCATDAAWHPQYSLGWTEGYCKYTLDCNSPSYSTELACCKGAYGGQISGECLSRLDSPPTTSPTDTGGLDIWYPDYDTAWPEAGCINDRPMPSGRPTYTTRLACCKGAYGGQVSGTCISQLESPPTTSPTTSGGVADFWYPDYDTAWTEAGCMNTLPLPYPNVNDRPNYKTQLACCKGAYGGQMSGVCISQLPNPPTTSPTGAGGMVDYWYPDYDTAWSEATCKNERPVPFNPGDRPTYKTQLACCKGAYGGQVSGACVQDLVNPPTTSPTAGGGLDYWYPEGNDSSWSVGVCLNTRPVPFGPGDRPTYHTEEECCSGYYGQQGSHSCICKADPCTGCECTGNGSWDSDKDVNGNTVTKGTNCPDIQDICSEDRK